MEASIRKHSIIFIDLDIHQEFVEVAYVEDGREHSPVHLGRIPSNKAQLRKLARKFECEYPQATLYFAN